MEEQPFLTACPSCSTTFKLLTENPPRYCPYCAQPLKEKGTIDSPLLEAPLQAELLLDRYKVIESIGKGGMGEVFLAFDTSCGRRIAIKKIRSDLLEHPHIRHRFLKEAHITCQLTHPAIIPIYSIVADKPSAFYTMPFVEGETLKQILRKMRQQEKKGEKIDQIGGSIAALMRIFMTICHAIAYAHSKGVLHRDLKPENIIVGKYGEVLILDWGLAKNIHSPLPEEEFGSHPSIEKPLDDSITKIGKIVGTISYMAPEIALGQQATIRTDIYALGVMLYQLLALRMPFKRGSVQEFRKNMSKEEWIDPIIAAPYREVPKVLSRVVEKCLQPDASARYQTVDELIRDLENYLEGRSEWFHAADLDAKRPDDWEFQEHVLIAEYIAITRITDEAEWVNLMISRQSFTGNTRIEASVCLGDSAHGIGILFSIPEASDRSQINEGYCLWIGSDLHRSTKLLRSSVEVMEAPDIILKRNQWTAIRIEKIDKSIHLYLDDVLQFSYIAHLPLIGTHIGVLSRDADFEMEPLKISVGSLNLTVNCLAVPDAFLAHRDFAQALSEYQRIAYSFPDRSEGREALFRAGLTLIEQAKGSNDKGPYLERALEEFNKLRSTPAGPLEYLGKALVYQTLHEGEEEIKCFEIAYRRYPNHPLLPVLQEQILSRLHQVSRQNRTTAYRFLLLTAHHFPISSIDTHTRRLFTSLQKHWEPLPFLEEHTAKIHPSQLRRFALPLAFWLAQPHAISEIIDEQFQSEQPSTVEICNAFATLIELGSLPLAKSKWEEIKETAIASDPLFFAEIDKMTSYMELSIEDHFQQITGTLSESLPFSQTRLWIFAMDRAIGERKPMLITEISNAFRKSDISYDCRMQLDLRVIQALLLEKKWREAGELINSYPLEMLNKGSTPLHFLYGCWLQATEGREMAMIHFTGLFHVPYPRSWTLASHELMGDLQPEGWIEKAFLWEKRELFRQLSLYWHCAGEQEKSRAFHQKYLEQFIS